MKENLIELDVFRFSPALKEQWKQGELHPEWATLYPDLFDEDDMRLAQNQSEYGYHFVEWLSAIFFQRNRLLLIDQ